jgi:hypothetical protein
MFWVEPVRIRAQIRLEGRDGAALEHVEAGDVVGLPDVDTRKHVSVVRPAHVAEERARAVERERDPVVVAWNGSERLLNISYDGWCLTEETIPVGTNIMPLSDTEAYVPTTSVPDATGRPCASSVLPIGWRRRR